MNCNVTPGDVLFIFATMGGTSVFAFFLGFNLGQLKERFKRTA